MKSLNVLIADDESIIRMDLKEMLTEKGHRVVGEAVNGEQAVRLCRELKPDLVVMDIKMPTMDGLQAAELIGREELAPVLILSAFSQENLVRQAQEAGVFAYLVKPFRDSDLAPAMEIAIARYREMRDLKEETRDLAERIESRKVIDKAKGLVMKLKGFSEPAAYKWLRDAAMTRRKTMRDLAEEILKDNRV